jgi:hypothetical protein
MCTVTFLPVRDKIFITSNRDEKRMRSHAVAPAIYRMRTGNIVFPRDLDAGGTWFAAHENGNVVVFLNGGWMKHNPQPPYRISRGIILLDIIDSDNPASKFLSANFANIEPFTAVIWCNRLLFECRWDGKGKTFRQLAEDLPHIWSSVTLYDEPVIKKREKWFTEWFGINKEPSQQEILFFHQFTGDGDKHNDLMMNRDGTTFTVSITSLEIEGETAAIKYLDFKNGETRIDELRFSKAIMYK